MKIIGAVNADVSSDFFHSFGEHTEVQHHAPDDFDYDQTVAQIVQAEQSLQAIQPQVAANTADIATNSTGITTNAADITTNTTNVATNTTGIATNTTNVTTNAADITTNTTNVTATTAKADGIAQFFDIDANFTKDHINLVNPRAVVQQGNTGDDFPPGLYFPQGTCSEYLQLIDDGRVQSIHSLDAGNSTSERWSYMFGAADEEDDPNTRQQYDGIRMEGNAMYDDTNDQRLANQPNRQVVQIKCSNEVANLEIVSKSKTSENTPIVFVEGSQRKFVVDRAGDVDADSIKAGGVQLKTNTNAVRATLASDSLRFFNAAPNAQSDNYNLRVNGAGLDGFFTMIMDKSSASTSDYITVRKGSGGNTAILTRLTHEGLWEPQVAAPVAGDPSRTHAPQHGSAVVDAQSLYVGNSRYSYDMTNRVLQLHKLKANHIPVYLQSSTTASDLPSGHNATHMTVNKWVDFARSHLSDNTLNVHDVFPYSNADWDAADAPTPTLTAAHTVTAGKVTTLETEMDDVEADILVKAPIASPTFTTKIRVEGTQGIDLRSTVGGAGTDSVIQYNSGLKIRNFQQTDMELRTNDTTRLTIKGTGEVQFDALTATTVPYLDANKRLVSSSVTPTQLGYLDATSSVQTQINSKQATLSAARLAVCDGDVFTSASYSTAVTVNSALALKAPLDDPSFTGSIEINGTALTSTAAELNYCDGVTSAIQTQLDAKQDTSPRQGPSSADKTGSYRTVQ